jgi:phage terminase small subunit
MSEDRKLTERQRRFIDEYMACGNGAEAARRAGYSEGIAKVQASENLTKQNVKAEIERRRREMSEDSEDRRGKWISALEALASSADKDADKLRAIEGLFKAEGWLAPEKSEVVALNGSFLADIDLEDEENPPDINDLH